MISPFLCVAELPVMMMIIADSWSMAELYSLELMIGGYLEVLLQSKFQENNIWQIAKWPWVNNNFQGLVLGTALNRWRQGLKWTNLCIWNAPALKRLFVSNFFANAWSSIRSILSQSSFIYQTLKAQTELIAAMCWCCFVVMWRDLVLRFRWKGC